MHLAIKADCVAINYTILYFSLYLIEGPHDETLKQSGHWPLRGTITIKLLSVFHYYKDKVYRNTFLQHYYCFDIITLVWSKSTLLPSNTLHYNAFLVGDKLTFKISYDYFTLKTTPVTIHGK